MLALVGNIVNVLMCNTASVALCRAGVSKLFKKRARFDNVKMPGGQYQLFYTSKSYNVTILFSLSQLSFSFK